jgi:predicted dehydrogenase
VVPDRGIRVRILEVGHGRWGAYYAEELADRGVLAGIVTATQTSADMAARRWQTRGHVDLQRALSEEVYDGVVVMSPTRLHVRHVRNVIDAGLPCMVAKPAATTTHDAQALHAFAAAARVPVLVAHDAVFEPRIAHVLAAIQSVDGRRATDVHIERRGDPETTGMPRSREHFLAWVYEAVMHDMSVCNRFAGRASPDDVSVSDLRVDTARPRLRVQATYATMTATIDLDHEPEAPLRQSFAIRTDDSEWVGEAHAHSSSLLHRRPGAAAQAVAVTSDGGQHGRLIDRFLALVRDPSIEPDETCADGARAVAAADEVVVAACREMAFFCAERIWARLGERPKGSNATS